MSVIKQFNGLGGTTITRQSLQEMHDTAVKEGVREVATRIKKILDTYPDENKFDIDEIDNPVTESLSVPDIADLKQEETEKGVLYTIKGVKVAEINHNGALQWHKKGLGPKIRAKIRKKAHQGLGVPLEMLAGLELIEETETEGLGKPVSPTEIYDMITSLMINTIKQVGHLPWQKEWVGAGKDKEVSNYVTKKPYTGANYILNYDIKFDKNGEPYLVPAVFEQPYYLTFNQIKEAGATLNKGAEARRVIYYTMIYNYDSENLKNKTADKGKHTEFVVNNNLTKEDLQKNLKVIPVVKYYNVFKADDCKGLKFKEIVGKKDVSPIESAQAIIDGYKDHPTYTFVGDEAAYYPKKDVLNMPNIKAFKQESFYYSTFFHEITHSTGHSKRLNRGNDTRKRDGSDTDKKAYAFEELVAELGAVFLCGESGILFHTKDNSAKYLAGWNKRLVELMGEDNRFYMKAAAAAQKAVNYVIGEAEKPKPTKKKPEPKPKREIKKASDYGKKRKREPKAKYIFNAEEIPYETARRAHIGTSFDPEKRAKQEQNRYFLALKEVYDTYLPKAEAKGKKTEFLEVFSKFKDGFLKRKLEYLHSRSGLYSTMIAGPANFPVARMEKKNRTVDAKMNEVAKWYENGIDKIKDILLEESEKPIKTGGENSLSLLEQKLDRLEKFQAKAVEANKQLRAIQKKETDFDTVVALYEKALEKIGFSEKEIENITVIAKRERRDFWLPIGTTNNGAEIRRLKQRIEIEKKIKVKAAAVTGTENEFVFEGGKVVKNHEINRLQILFDDKPDESMRSALKQGGFAFKWSPANKAWQRQLNTFYRWEALEKLLTGLDFKKKQVETKAEVKPKRTKAELEELNPKPFDKKPLSVAVSTAIKDVLSLPKFAGEKEMQASLVYKLFKDKENLQDFDIVEASEFEANVLKKNQHSNLYYGDFTSQYYEEIAITNLGIDFIKAVNGRLESLKNQKHNFAMFDGLKVPIVETDEPIFPKAQDMNIVTTARQAKGTSVFPQRKNLMDMHFESLPMDSGWENFMQNPAKNMKIAIWGAPKNGKTAGSLQLANYLTKFGTVLYNFADQGFNLSTQELWKSSGLANNPKAEASDANTLADLEREMAITQPTFIFIDMISDYIRKEKIKPEEFKERFVQKYPNTSFILIFEVTKGGNFKGDQGWTHLVDATVTVEDFLMENRGRYGMGYHVVWDEGFKKYNPKKYTEVQEFLQPTIELTEEIEVI